MVVWNAWYEESATFWREKISPSPGYGRNVFATAIGGCRLEFVDCPWQASCMLTDAGFVFVITTPFCSANTGSVIDPRLSQSAAVAPATSVKIGSCNAYG